MTKMNRTTRFSLLFLLTVSIIGPCADAADHEPHWDPAKTRVFAVSLNRFKGGEAAPWDKEEHLDVPFVELLKRRGVPESQVQFLLDDRASSQNIRKELNELLSNSHADELLIFYFGSHGGYNPKSSSFSFSSFDGHLPFEWAFDSIESRFKGSRVLMFADCCYSGGIVEIAARRRSPIAYACLSSTYSHNLGYSGFRFIDCLMRGFSGSAELDLNGNGHVELADLARFTAKHMAFVAEGMPMFATTHGFDSKLVLSDTVERKKDSQVGQYVEAFYNGKWLKSEIMDVKPGHVRVHHTDRGTHYNEWVAANQVRPFTCRHFPVGAKVLVEEGPSGKADPAIVLESWENLHLCRYDGYSPAYDEWIGPGRLSAIGSTGWSGQWAGVWENSVGEKGDDSLVLIEDAKGNLSGVWSGDVKITGKPANTGTAHFSGETSSRSYQFTATQEQA